MVLGQPFPAVPQFFNGQCLPLCFMKDINRIGTLRLPGVVFLEQFKKWSNDSNPYKIWHYYEYENQTKCAKYILIISSEGKSIYFWSVWDRKAELGSNQRHKARQPCYFVSWVQLWKLWDAQECTPEEPVALRSGSCHPHPWRQFPERGWWATATLSANSLQLPVAGQGGLDHEWVAWALESSADSDFWWAVESKFLIRAVFGKVYLASFLV